MAIRFAHSQRNQVREIAADLFAQLQTPDARVVVYFGSSCHDQQALAAELADRFPRSQICGCSTAGEIVSGQMLKNAVVAMALPGDVVSDAAVELVGDLADPRAIQRAFDRFGKHFGGSMMDLPLDKHVGLIMIDGLSGAEEKVMDTIGNLTNLTFLGGSAGDDLAFKKTVVTAGKQAQSGAAVLCLLKLEKGFEIIKTQSFRPTAKILRATRVDEARRTVHEFDGEPAVAAYARAVGAPPAKVAEHFMRCPVGLMTPEGPFVRSPQRTEGGSMVFYCNIKQGMDMTLLESTDIVEDTRKALEKKQKEMGRIAGLINFHCILRTLELINKNQCEAYGQLFESIPTIGFSTYGEQLIGHINQTSTMLALRG